MADLHFPGLHPDPARWLVAERAIGAIGLDTASIDHGPSSDFLAHRILFEAEIPAFETGRSGWSGRGARDRPRSRLR